MHWHVRLMTRVPISGALGHHACLPKQVSHFADKLQINIWALIANSANEHFEEALSTRQQLEELKVAMALARASAAQLSKEVIVAA